MDRTVTTDDEIRLLRRTVAAIDHDEVAGVPDYEYEMAPDQWVKASEWRKLALKRLSELSSVEPEQ